MEKYSKFKYQVVTEHSSLEPIRTNWMGDQILFETNNFQEARRECIEWAAWDDIVVRVVKRLGLSYSEKFCCDGAFEAETRYPRTAEAWYEKDL